MFNKVTLEERKAVVEEIVKSVVAYEMYRHRSTYGNISKYEKNKIHKDVEYYFNSLSCHSDIG